MVAFTPFQLVAILFALFMIFITALMVKKKRVDLKGSILWFILWGGLVIAILLFQQITTFSTTYLDIEPQDLFIFVAIFALLAIVFQLQYTNQKLKKNIGEMTYEMARRDSKK